jgi:hypothetical protein
MGGKKMTRTSKTNNKSLSFGPVARMVSIAVCLMFLSVGLAAQETTVTSTTSETTSVTADTSESTSAAAKKKDDPASDYKVISSFEIGVRGKEINGSENKYRSDLNYNSGVRIFDSSFLIKPKDSKGKVFDSLLVTGSGWSADPNGYTRINMEKTGWYNFDSSIRRMTYFNNLTNFALNEHNRNTKRNMADFDLTVLPQNDFSFRVGVSHNDNTGPATNTYDYSRDEIPILSEYDTSSWDFRVGFDAKLLGFNVSFTEGLRRFRDETNFRIDMPQLGNNPNPNASFTTFSRTMPERGEVNYHSLSINRTFEKKIDFTGRIIYSESTSRFGMIEEITGFDRFGNNVVLDQSEVNGNAKRPNLVGDIGLTFFATDKFSISNTFSANSYRISGGNVLFGTLIRTTSGGAPLPTSISNDSVYRFTNFKRYINTLEANYDVNRYFSFYAGYRYTHREVDLTHLDTDLTDNSTSFGTETAENTTNALIAGFKLTPVRRKWTIFFDVEHGEADNSFTRLGNKAMTNVKVRSRFKPVDNLSINLSFKARDNNTPGRPGVTIPDNFSSDVKAQNFSASLDWLPNDKASVSAGFTHNRLDAETSVRFPVTGASGQGLSSYELRSNYGHIDAWVRPTNRVSFFGSYRISKDTGRGDMFSASTFSIDGSYPISFQSPEMRFTMKVNRNIDLNVGYQYYKFEETILNSQNYSAHLPYASVRLYFGGSDR